MGNKQGKTKKDDGLKEPKQTSWYELCCAHLTTIIVIVLTVLFYLIQVALPFALFNPSISPTSMLYCSPAWIFPVFAFAAIVLGRFPGLWKIVAMFTEIIVAVLNVAALGLLIYLFAKYSGDTNFTNGSRIGVFWVNYLIFSVVMVLASIGSLIMGIDDVRWYIRYKKQQDGKGDYEKMDVKHDNEDL